MSSYYANPTLGNFDLAVSPEGYLFKIPKQMKPPEGFIKIIDNAVYDLQQRQLIYAFWGLPLVGGDAYDSD